MDRGKARIAIYAMAGVYLVIIAYQMFQNLGQSASESERMLTLIFSIIFAVVGAVMIGVGIWHGNKNMKEYKEEYYSVPKEDNLTEEEELTKQENADISKENDGL